MSDTHIFKCSYSMLGHVFKGHTKAACVLVSRPLDYFYAAFSDCNISRPKKESVPLPTTNCHGTRDRDPLGYNRRRRDITGLLIQHTEFRSTHLDKLNTGETKYVKLIFFSSLKNSSSFSFIFMKIFFIFYWQNVNLLVVLISSSAMCI